MRHLTVKALYSVSLIILLAWALPFQPANAADEACLSCHNPSVHLTGGKHATLRCVNCHEGSGGHLNDPADPKDPELYPRVHFDQEVCMGCHQEQYDTYEVVARGPTYYGGSDDSATPPKGWSKTRDLPYWNVLIDGHPFVLETYEDSPMAVNQIEHQETIRPGSEACLECHGTKVAFAMGIEYRDADGVIHTIPPTKSSVTFPDGTEAEIPAREYTLKEAHTIYDGTTSQDPASGEWLETVNTTLVPAGTRMWTYTDAVNLSGQPGDPIRQPYQVKSLVTLPEPLTATLADGSSITFQTIASYPEAGADINGQTGVAPTAAPDAQVATLARDWIYAAFEALAFDGLNYYFNDPGGHTTFTGGGANWPSVQSGELCNQCHDPHSGKLRIVRKALIAAIAERGINPYSPSGSKIYDFNQASRQDQIIAVCAQCHSEYVGGYSAITGLDQDYFPWAKPTDLEILYRDLFGYLQDWSHGGPVVPWQSFDENARGFLPYGERFPIGAPLVKVQHPEAETFFNSPMYNAGATCTDCHSSRVTRPDGSRYTSHWFVSPLKLMDGFSGQTATGKAITLDPQNPCTKCHTTDTFAQSEARIKGVQDQFHFIQERTQVALVNALKFISEQQTAGVDQAANIATYQRAAMRWEYYTQAENSMGFHNDLEATREVANARIWVDNFIPWPLTPVQVRIASRGPDTLTLAFFDQATDENGFIVERSEALEGPYSQVADIPTPNGINLGDVEWTDVTLAAGTTYFYRVAAYSAAGTSAYSIWAEGTTQGTALPAPSNLVANATGGTGIALTWQDNSSGETGFRIERARDAAFTVEFTAFTTAADSTAFSDSELTPGTTYFYRVFAEDLAGSSAPSNTASTTTLAAPPEAPTNLVAVSASRSGVQLAWRDNADNETGFYLERRRLRRGESWTRIATLPGDATSHTDSDVVRRTRYRYRVQAYNSIGESAYSNKVTVRIR